MSKELEHINLEFVQREELRGTLDLISNILAILINKLGKTEINFNDEIGLFTAIAEGRRYLDLQFNEETDTVTMEVKWDESKRPKSI